MSPRPRPWLRVPARVAAIFKVPYATSLDQHARRLTQRYGIITALVFVALVVIAWPTDFLAFRDNEAHFWITFDFRIAILVWSVVALATMRLINDTLEWLYLCIAVLASLAAAIAGVTMSRYGGFDTQYFHYGLLLPFLAMALPQPLVPRACTTVLISAAFVTCYLLTNPHHTRDVNVITPLITLAALTLGVIALGHVYYRIIRTNHEQHTALETLTHDLERQVQERTAQLRRFATHVETSREDERKRIGRELHDELAQLFTAMRVELKLAARHHRDAVQLRSTLARVDGILALCFGAKDRILTALRPPELDELGFAVALRQFVATVGQRTGIDMRVAMDDDVEMANDVATAAFRSVQEAITNIVRHASASRVSVVVRSVAGKLDMEIVDNGDGFETDATCHSGFGIVGMRERVDALAGSVDISSALGEGVRVHIVVPLRSQLRHSP